MEVQRIQVSGKCLVCFNEFDHQAHSRDNIGTLKCGHIFHFDCVEKLLHQGQKDCIICNKKHLAKAPVQLQLGWQCEAEDAAEDDVKADVDNEKAVEPGEQQQEEGSSQGSQSKVTKQRGRKRRAKAAPKTKSKKKRSDSPYSATSSVMCMDDIHEDMEEVDAVPVQSASQSSHEDLSKNKHPDRNGSGDAGEEGLDNNFTLEDNKQAKIFEDSEVKNEVPSRQVSEIQIPNAILPKQSVDNRNGGSERSSITSSALEGAVEGMTVPKEEIDESSAQVFSEKSTISDALICESQHIPEILSQNNTILEVESVGGFLEAKCHNTRCSVQSNVGASITITHKDGSTDCKPLILRLYEEQESMDVENKQQNSGIVPYPQVDIKQEKADEVGEDLQSVKIEVKEEVQDDSYGDSGSTTSQSFFTKLRNGFASFWNPF